MKQKYKSILEAIGSIIVAISIFLLTNDTMLRYGFPIVFLLLATYKLNEAREFSKQK